MGQVGDNIERVLAPHDFGLEAVERGGSLHLFGRMIMEEEAAPPARWYGPRCEAFPQNLHAHKLALSCQGG